MEPSQVGQVRSFNRTITSSIGVLDERFLGRGRPLGEARFLWEIGDAEAEVRELRLRLGLDSGYVSRLLRSLERQGLVAVVPDRADARQRRVHLTAAGQAERRELDRRSDKLATSLLEPLSELEREQLVKAMAEVEHLVLRAQLTIAQEPADSADVRWCFGRYFAELDSRFDGGYDVRKARAVDTADLTPPAGLVLLVRIGDEPVGCGALRLHPDGIAEVKRLWVSPRLRGLGLGSRLLLELEGRAASGGATRVRLDTNRNLVEAIAMYRRLGYREVQPFNDEPYAHHWFEKELIDQSALRSPAAVEPSRSRA